MAYELYIFPPEDVSSTLTPATVVGAFTRSGVPCSEQPDESGHWLVLEGYESALDLTVENGIVTGAGFRYVTKDDQSVVQRVAETFKGLGWLVSDDEGML